MSVHSQVHGLSTPCFPPSPLLSLLSLLRFKDTTSDNVDGVTCGAKEGARGGSASGGFDQVGIRLCMIVLNVVERAITILCQINYLTPPVSPSPSFV